MPYKIRHQWEDCAPPHQGLGWDYHLARCAVDGGWLYKLGNQLTFVPDVMVACVDNEGELAKYAQMEIDHRARMFELIEKKNAKWARERAAELAKRGADKRFNAWMWAIAIALVALLFYLKGRA